MNERTVFIIGDLNGDIDKLNNFINQKIRRNPVLPLLSQGGHNSQNIEVSIICCGEPQSLCSIHTSKAKLKNEVEFLKDGVVKIYCCLANHSFEKFLRSEYGYSDIVEIEKGIMLCGFGATLKISPKINVLFAGSAGLAAQDRVSGSGIPAKCAEICDYEINQLEHIQKVDWVISHEAPSFFNLHPWESDLIHFDKNRDFLDHILWKYKVKKWFFSHYRTHMKGYFAGCQWESLSNLNDRQLYWRSFRV